MCRLFCREKKNVLVILMSLGLSFISCKTLLWKSLTVESIVQVLFTVIYNSSVYLILSWSALLAGCINLGKYFMKHF